MFVGPAGISAESWGWKGMLVSQVCALFQRVSLDPIQSLSIPAPPKFQFLSLPELMQLRGAFMGLPKRGWEVSPSTNCSMFADVLLSCQFVPLLVERRATIFP